MKLRVVVKKKRDSHQGRGPKLGDWCLANIARWRRGEKCVQGVYRKGGNHIALGQGMGAGPAMTAEALQYLGCLAISGTASSVRSESSHRVN